MKSFAGSRGYRTPPSGQYERFDHLLLELALDEHKAVSMMRALRCRFEDCGRLAAVERVGR
jgi:hypothetical protein